MGSAHCRERCDCDDLAEEVVGGDGLGAMLWSGHLKSREDSLGISDLLGRTPRTNESGGEHILRFHPMEERIVSGTLRT